MRLVQRVALTDGRRRPVNRSRNLAILLGCLLIMPTPTSADSTPTAQVRLTTADAGRSVELSIGQILEVALEENPTTGYVWELETVDRDILQPVQTDYLVNQNSIGSGGTAIFRFKAGREGRTFLKLICHRSFEKDSKPIGTFAATVLVKNRQDQ